MKRPRTIGTTEESIAAAEAGLGRRLPPDFRAWLIEHNGTGIDYVHIYPVRDERDPRKTWESIVHNFKNGWQQWLANFDEEDRSFEHLLPFADFGSGDYYCFDYSGPGLSPTVILWSHETGDTEHRADSFAEFLAQILAGDLHN